MEFQNRVLTSAGKALVAQASSANKIILVRALSSTTYMDANALRNVEPSDFTGPSGTIKTTSATNNVARVIAEYTNQPVATTVKTVAIVARLSTQSDEDAVVVAALSDSTASIYIPSTSDLSTSIQVAFNITIGNASVVSVNSAANVSLGDFERLMERIVTTHADGDADEGDNPTIKGDKAFDGNCTFDGTILEVNGTLIGNVVNASAVNVSGAIACDHVQEANQTVLSNGVGGLYYLEVIVTNSNQQYPASFVLRRGSLFYHEQIDDDLSILTFLPISGSAPGKYRSLMEVSGQIAANASETFNVLAVKVEEMSSLIPE